MNLLNLPDNPYFAPLLILAVVWTLSWKGLALWHSARNKQKTWFIVLLVVNTMAILEVIYLVFFEKKKS